MAKVYCSKCRYYTNYSGPQCWTKDNTREQSNWLEPITVTVIDPQDLNKNNDCSDFEEIPSENT